MNTTHNSGRGHQANIRIDRSEWVAFCDACKSAGANASTVARVLFRLTGEYTRKHCGDGVWRPPRLVTDAEASRLNAGGDAEREERESTQGRKGRSHRPSAPIGRPRRENQTARPLVLGLLATAESL